MSKTILQVPLSSALRHNAEEVAMLQGFSSLQEVVRVFLSRFADRKVEMVLQEPVLLSEKTEKLYSHMNKDFREKKNVYTASNVGDLMKQLHENPLS